MDTRPLIKKAVSIVGTQQALAERLTEIMGRQIKQQNVWRWVHTVKVIPGDYVIPIEKAVDGEVSRRELRPDLYSQ